MTSIQVVETSVTNSSSFQNYPHPDDHTIRTKDMIDLHSSMHKSVSSCEAPETFRARKAIFNQSVSKNWEVYMSENFCIKRNSLRIKSMWIKQFCNHKIWDFATCFRLQKLFGTFEKPGRRSLREFVIINSRRNILQAFISQLLDKLCIYNCDGRDQSSLLGFFPQFKCMIFYISTCEGYFVSW